MTLNLIDRSNYLRGIILLNIKTATISPRRRMMISNIGSLLGFNRDFVQSALNELIENKYLVVEPPKFSHVLFAEAFLKDGIKMALSDNDLQLNEFKWLWTIASLNNLSKQWLYMELEDFLDHMENLSKGSFEIQKYLDEQKN